MSTPTPRTDAIYLAHRHWANEDEATEAIEDFRDLARTLERELAAERARLDWLQAHALPQHSESISISKLGKHYNGFPGSLRAAIDATMKEEAK